MTYKVKLILLYLAFSSILLLFVWNTATTNHQDTKSRVVNRLSSDSLLIGEWIRAQVDNAGFLLNGVNVQLAQNPQNELGHQQFLTEQAALLPNASLIGSYDHNCQLRVSNYASRLDASDREYCELVKKAPLNTNVVTNTYTTHQNKRNIAVARSFDRGTGQLQGFSLVSIDLSFFNVLIDQLEYDSSSIVAIFDHNMVLLGRYPMIPGVIGQYVEQKDAEKFLQNSTQSTTFLEVKSPVDQIHRLYVLRKVEGLPFLIVIGLTSETWMFGYQARLVSMLFLTLLLFLLGFLAVKNNLSIHRQSALLKVMKDNAERDARIDPLTGLDNRRSFYEIGELEFSRHKRYGINLCLLVIDLDHFKRVNDEFGHVIGDSALKTVAQAIKQTIRSSDSSFRLGGEEFAILLPETDLAKARVLAERLRIAIIESSEQETDLPTCTASIGLSQAGDSIDNFQGLVKQADLLMYAAKDRGRNQVAALS